MPMGGAAVLRFDFDNDTRAPAEARQAVASWFGDLDSALRERVALAVSELVTNVVRHTPTGGNVRAWQPASDLGVRVEVEDLWPFPPVDRGEIDVGGRGLLIVDKLCDAWGVHPGPHGKVLWAEFSGSTR